MAAEDYLDDFGMPTPTRKRKKYPDINPAVKAHNAIVLAKQALLVEVLYPNCRQAYTYWAPLTMMVEKGGDVLVRAVGDFVVAKVHEIRQADARCLGLPYALSPVLMCLDSRGANMAERFHAASAKRVLAGDCLSTVEREAARLLKEQG